MKVNVADVFNRGMLACIRAYVDPRATEIYHYTEFVIPFQGCQTCGGEDTVNVEIHYDSEVPNRRYPSWGFRHEFQYSGSLAEFLRNMDDVDVEVES